MLQASRHFVTTARPALLARWLFVVAGLIVVMVVIGGITRLTESGLSITRWKPLTGIVPPLTHAEWQAEFANYRRIPQYEAIHHGMTLAGFQAIFFWEYLHRAMARVVVTAFAAPLIWFALRRRMPAGYGWRLSALLGLLGLQGALGWWMVASGLSVRTEVAPLWLAAHLLTALFTLGGMVWTGLDLRAMNRTPLARPAHLGWLGAVAGIALFVQLFYGALMAGLRAGLVASDWPLMNGAFFPTEVIGSKPAGQLLIADPAIVHFVHRWFAFVAAAVMIWLAFRARAVGDLRAGQAVVLLVCLQVALGISTVLTGVQIGVAVAHQANAALLLVALVAAAHAVGRRTP